MTDLLTVQRMHYPHLSKCQRQLADFIARDPTRAGFMTAGQLGKAVGVSESSVVRYAQRLGLAGFPELQEGIRQLVRTHTSLIALLDHAVKRDGAGSSASRDGETRGDPDDGGPALLQRVIQMDVDLIRRTGVRNDWTRIQTCIDAICGARQVYTVGHRNAYPLALFLSRCLVQSLGVGITLAYGIGDVFDSVATMGVGDVLIGISLPRPSSATVAVMRAARRRGVHVIAITDSALGVVARSADETLLVSTDSASFALSQVGTMTLINILLAGIAHRAEARSRQHLEDIEALLRANHVLLEGDELFDDGGAEAADDGTSARAQQMDTRQEGGSGEADGRQREGGDAGR